MSRSPSPDPASERTPLLSPEPQPDESPKRSRWSPSIIALVTLCVSVIIALAVGFAAPAIVEEYAKEAAVFNLDTVAVESFTDTGIQARIKGTIHLDASKVTRKPIRDLGRFGTWIARAVRTGDSQINVYLPKYNNSLLGTANAPPMILNIRNNNVNHLDMVVDVEPGPVEGIKAVVQDFLHDKLSDLNVKAIANVPVRSGLISLGTKSVAQSLHFKKGKQHMPQPKLQKLKVAEYGQPGHSTGVLAHATLSARNPYPVTLDIPPVAVDMLLKGCSGEYIVLGTALTDVIHVASKHVVYANITGLAKKLPESLTMICPHSNKSAFDIFVGAYLEGKDPQIYVRGAQQDDDKTPEWIGEFLREFTVPVPVPPRKFDSLIKRFSMSDVNLRLPEAGSPDSKPRISAIVNVVVAVPKDIDITVDVERIRSNADVLYEGQKLGELDLHEWQKANSSKHHDELWIQSTVLDAPMSVTNSTVFADLVRQMLFGKGGVTLGVHAKVDVESTTALGQFIVRGVPAEGEISMDLLGGGGFKQEIKSIKVVDSNKDTLVMKTRVKAINPTDYSAHLPFVNVSLWCNDTNLGDAWGSFDIVPGSNDITAYASYRKSSVAKEFLSQYLSGQNVTATVQTHEGSIPGFPTTNMALNVTVPHVFGKFLNETTMHIFTSTATFLLHSPISMYITAINASAYYNGTDIGNIDYDLPFKVIAGDMESPRLPVAWNNNGGFSLIKEALGGRLKLDARANVSVKIGHYEDTIWYDAKGLGAKVRL